MYVFYYHFNNLRFNKSQTTSFCVLETCCLFVSSGIMKRRLLLLFLDHPMNILPPLRNTLGAVLAYFAGSGGKHIS